MLTKDLLFHVYEKKETDESAKFILAFFWTRGAILRASKLKKFGSFFIRNKFFQMGIIYNTEE